MKPGMTTKVDLLIQKLEGVLTVPREAVMLVDGKPSVFRVDGGLDPIEVQVGARNATDVVVEDGLAKGDAVFLGALWGNGGRRLRPVRQADDPAPEAAETVT